MNESVALPFCAKCEDKANPVTSQNGFGVSYQLEEHVFIELFLHEKCADEWYREFGASRKHLEIECLETDGNMKHSSDVTFEERVRQRAHEIYLERKENPALQDWLLAEVQVRRQLRRFDDRNGAHVGD
jgi:hypothetical protein